MIYIILFLIAIFIGWSYIKAKARMHHVNQTRAERELGTNTEVSYPSWAAKDNRMKEFIAMQKAAGRRNNIPDKFVAGMFLTDYSRDRLLFLAGMMEKHGSSFEEQAMAVSDKVNEYWRNTTQSERQQFS